MAVKTPLPSSSLHPNSIFMSTVLYLQVRPSLTFVIFFHVLPFYFFFFSFIPFFPPFSCSPASSPIHPMVSVVLIKTSPSCHRGNFYCSSSLHRELMQDVREGWEIQSCHEWIVNSQNKDTERLRHSQFCTLRIYSILKVVWWTVIKACSCNSALTVLHDDMSSTYATWIPVFFPIFK